VQSPWKVVFAFLGVFAAGAVFGGLFTMRASGKRFAPTPTVVALATPAIERKEEKEERKAEKAARPQQAPGIAPAMVRQFTQRLNLNAEQREKIRPLVGRAAEDLQRLTRDYLQETSRVREQMYIGVSAWLTPEQKSIGPDARRLAGARAQRKREARVSEGRRSQRAEDLI